MTAGVSAESVGKSQEFFSNPESYGPLGLTPDKRSIVTCIEPRDPADIPHGQYDITMQTGGGGAGESLDGALAGTIEEEELVSIETAMEQDKHTRPLTVFEGHENDCRFILGLVKITREMADPSDFTLDGVARWSKNIGQLLHVKGTLGKVSSAAAFMAEYLEEREHMDELLHQLDGLYPHHKNVKPVKGQNHSRLYVVNFHPKIGKDRNKKPTDPTEAAKIQGYHDSLAATTANLRGENGLTNATRGLRLTSMVLRAAATRTVITERNMGEMTFFEVEPTPDPPGIKIVEKTYN
jgi:hypothetical protein